MRGASRWDLYLGAGLVGSAVADVTPCLYGQQDPKPDIPDSSGGNKMANTPFDRDRDRDRRGSNGHWRRGIAGRPVTTRAKMASRLTCGHEVKRGDPIVNRGNGWLCEGCATVTSQQADGC